jgi:hypothetical protein
MMARATNASLAQIDHGDDLRDSPTRQGIALARHWAEYERGYGWVACTARGRLGFYDSQPLAERAAAAMYAKEGA